MLFSLDVLRAGKGDCLLLHFGSNDDPRVVMIDGGPADVYAPHLKPRLEQLRQARSLTNRQALSVDVLMVSHVDDDHIKGILDLTRELREQKQERRPLFLRVGSLWHNSFDDLLDTTPAVLNTQAGFGAAALAGEIELEDAEDFDAAKVLASIPQGRDLRIDAEFLGWKINRHFKGQLILANGAAKTVSLDGSIKFTVVGPMKPELKALQEKHDDWLRQRGMAKDSQAALAAFVDRSIPNLSSIVLLAEAQGKTMLLTGDARGDKILEGLQLAGVLDPDGNSTIRVDVLKVPHHGSANNFETSFFESVTADHYVFSGDGEHGNPERESLEMLLAARGDDAFTLHFTYPIEEIDKERKKDWQKQQAREKKKKEKNPRQRVRANWSPRKHSLAALFEDHRELAGKIRIVEAGKPHVINLLDDVRF